VASSCVIRACDERGLLPIANAPRRGPQAERHSAL
jgi:hypothetical protein